jgi:hypothetical protein
MVVNIKGHQVEIDKDDEHFLNEYRWHVSSKGNGSFYVQTRSKREESYYLHRLIAGAAKGQIVDHKDMNTLNCRRENLRICNPFQSAMNKNKYKNNRSGYKGVIRVPWGWVAMIRVNHKGFHLGVYDSPEKASEAYKRAAIRIAGEFARG